jgi:hypothetical protein
MTMLAAVGVDAVTGGVGVDHGVLSDQGGSDLI